MHSKTDAQVLAKDTIFETALCVELGPCIVRVLRSAESEWPSCSSHPRRSPWRRRGRGRTVADVRALDAVATRSRIAIVLYRLRQGLGRMFGWDRQRIRPEASLLRRLSDCDRRNSQVPPGTPDGEFLVLYRFPGEELREILNATVHGFLCTALVSTPTDYLLYWGVYVRRASWLTRPYLLAIEPFRWILYPAMLRRLRRSWIAAYDGA